MILHAHTSWNQVLAAPEGRIAAATPSSFSPSVPRKRRIAARRPDLQIASEKKSATLALALIAAAALASLALVVDRGGVWSNDQALKILQVKNLLAEGGGFAYPYPAADLDPEAAFSPLPTMFTWEHDGAYYPIFSYIHALLSAPFALLLGEAGIHVLPLLGLLLSAWLAGILLRRLAPRAPGWSGPLAVGLATPMFFYGLVVWEHSLCVAALLAAVALATREGARTPARIGAGVLVALGVGLRPEAIMFAPALLAGMLALDRRVGRWLPGIAGGLVLGFAPQWAVNHSMLGAMLGPDFSWHAQGQETTGPWRELIEGRGHLIMVWFVEPAGRVWAVTGLALVVVGYWLHRRPNVRPWLYAALAGYAVWTAAAHLPAVVNRTLVGSTPIVLLALLPFPAGPRAPLARALTTAGLVYVLLVVLASPNDGGAQWAARYLLPAIPLLTLRGLGAAFEGGASRLSLACVAVVALSSAALQVEAVRDLGRITSVTSRLLDEVREHPAEVVVTDTGYAAHLLGPVFLEKKITLVRSSEDLAALATLCRDAGVDRILLVAGLPWTKDPATHTQAALEATALAAFPFYRVVLLDGRL